MFLLKKLLNHFLRIVYNRKALFLGRVLMGRFTRIINDGSKNNITVYDNVMLYCRLISRNGGKIILHNNVNIRKNTMIGAINLIEIHENVIISNNVTIVDNNNHPTHPESRLEMIRSGWGSDKWQWEHSDSAPIIIESNVWIGQNSRILKGVRIGKNSIVAADCVVTKDVPENSIVAGNPGVIVKRDIDNLPRKL